MILLKYNAKEFSKVGDKYLRRAYSEMDCQKFVETCMADVGLRMDLAGSNAWYRKMSWVGSPEECVRRFGSVPKGALLFILEKDGKEPAKYRGDGIGNASHIGIKTGRGDGAIHSSSSRGCVAQSKFRDKTIPNGGWNRVGLWDRFSYGTMVDGYLGHNGDQEQGKTENDDQGDEKMQENKTENLGNAHAPRANSHSPRAPRTTCPLSDFGTVAAPSGSTVNLRKKKGGALLDRIPIGTEVEILDYGAEWCKVKAGRRVGYMMTRFIDVGDSIPGEESPGENEAVWEE